MRDFFEQILGVLIAFFENIWEDYVRGELKYFCIQKDQKFTHDRPTFSRDQQRLIVIEIPTRGLVKHARLIAGKRLAGWWIRRCTYDRKTGLYEVWLRDPKMQSLPGMEVHDALRFLYFCASEVDGKSYTVWQGLYRLLRAEQAAHHKWQAEKMTSAELRAELHSMQRALRGHQVSSHRSEQSAPWRTATPTAPLEIAARN